MVAEERRQRLVEIHVDADTRVIDIDDPRNARSSPGQCKQAQQGLRGVGFTTAARAPVRGPGKGAGGHHRGKRLLQRPRRGADLSVGGDPQRDRGLFLTDLSSLYYDKASDHLLVLSDESRVVIELIARGSAWQPDPAWWATMA